MSSLEMEADNSPVVSRQTDDNEIIAVPSTLSTYLSWQQHAYEEQQVWMGKLGDRECDFLEFSKLRPLQMKVGFAMYSHPTQCSNTHLYASDKNEHVMKICTKITELAQEIYSDGIYLTVLYVYCLIEESKILLKKKEAEMFQNVLFKIRKGRHSREEYYIDTNTRVYTSWEDFKCQNTFPNCWYALPQEGKYQSDASGKVLLEFEKSPACSFKNKILSAVDIGGLVLGVGGVVGSFVFPPASPLLISSLIASGASGVFSGGRCISKLSDRHSHKQSLKDKDGILLWIELSLSTLTVGMSATSIVNSVRAARAAATVSEVTAATSIGEKATSVATETVAVAKSSQSAVTGGKTAGKAASKLTRTVSKGGKAATKIGETTNRGARIASKLSSASSKGHHSASKILKGSKAASKLAKRGASASSKAAKIVKSAENISDAVKVVKKTKKALQLVQKASELSEIATENLPVTASASVISSTTNVGIAAKEEISLFSNFSQFFSDIGTQGFKFIQTPSGFAVTTVGAAGFSTVTTFALKVLLQISVDYIYSNLTMKHKELLQEILNLITKIQSGSIKPVDIVKFISFINFYFNTLIINHENFIDNFIWRIYETAKKWLTREDLSNSHLQVTQRETQVNDLEQTATPESTQIWNSTISSNGNAIITSFISELEAAEIDWANVDFSIFEQKNLP